MQGRVSCLGASTIAALLLLACGGSKEESTGAAYPMTTPQNQAQPGQAQSGYAQPGQQQPMQQQPVQQQPAQQQPAQQQPVQQQPAQTTTGAVTAVQEVDASMAASVQPLIQQLAKSQVPAGAKPLGNMIVANFPTGGKLEKQIQLTGNKCYTVVAQGAPGVNEVNLKFYNLPLLPLAVDNTTGAQATIGASPNCYKQIIMSAPMTLSIEVPQGQGLVGVQVYEK